MLLAEDATGKRVSPYLEGEGGPFAPSIFMAAASIEMGRYLFILCRPLLSYDNS